MGLILDLLFAVNGAGSADRDRRLERLPARLAAGGAARYYLKALPQGT